MTLWRPDDRGYTPIIDRAGRYSKEQIENDLDYYNGGENIAIPAEIIESMGQQPPVGWFDYRGLAVPNTKESWQRIVAATVWVPKGRMCHKPASAATTQKLAVAQHRQNVKLAAKALTIDSRSQVLSLATSAESIFSAVLDCSHSITDNEVVLRFDRSLPGLNAAAQLMSRIGAAVDAARKAALVCDESSKQ